MASSQTPHWGFILFLVIMYAISYLLHIDPNISNPGGAGAIGSITAANTTDVFTTAISMPGYVADLFGYLWSVATFGDLGLPLIVQLVIAIPCLLLLVWCILAFVGAIRNVVLGGS